MVGSALIELCGSVIFGLTRSVAEHYDQIASSLIQEHSVFIV